MKANDKRRNNKGGARRKPGTGLKYGEETVNITMRVPKSRKKEFKEKVKKILSKWVIKKKK